MAGYLVYHPKRCRTKIGKHVVHHDRWTGNQDPYIWNRHFLHTFCHMTQMTPQEGMWIIWVTGDGFPDFTRLFCDLVFLVKNKMYWREANSIRCDDPIVD